MAKGPAEDAGREQALGDQLSAYRKLARLTQAQLARRLYCDRTSIAHVERGQRAKEAFWREADDAVNAGGRLLAGFRQLDAAKTQAGHAAQLAEIEQYQRKIAQWRG